MIGLVLGVVFVSLGAILLALNIPVLRRLRTTYILAPFGDDAAIRSRTMRSPKHWGRFPDPNSSQGAHETRTRLRCMTYARLSRDRAQNWEYFSEVVLVVSGAALGTTILTPNPLTAVSLVGALAGVLARMISVRRWKMISAIYEERARRFGGL